MADHALSLGKCFRAYDIRGRVPEELAPEDAYAIAYTFAIAHDLKYVVTGYDSRKESFTLHSEVLRGFAAAGVRVSCIGRCLSEQLYYHVCVLQADGGIMVTASHNPDGWGGFKLVLKNAHPVTKEQLVYIRDHLFQHRVIMSTLDNVSFINPNEGYITYLKDRFKPGPRPLRIVVNLLDNPGLPAIREILAGSCITAYFIENEERKHNLGPNPLLPENQETICREVIANECDFGAIFDGDGDRVVFVDPRGRVVQGCYAVAMMLEHMLDNQMASRLVLYDQRVVNLVKRTIRRAGHNPVPVKAGHGFIKEQMQKCKALFAGEISGHFYFEEFFGCDSGVLALLKMIERFSQCSINMSRVVDRMAADHPCSNEINFTVKNPAGVMAKVLLEYSNQTTGLSYADGLTLIADRWRFNLRQSNTENVLRLNIETEGDVVLMKRLRGKLSNFIAQWETVKPGVTMPPDPSCIDPTD